MCEGSRVSAEIEYVKVPLMNRVKELTAKFIYADNTMRNWKSYEGKVQGITGESLLTLFDPQTSGGLLIAVAEGKENEFHTLATQAGVNAQLIGETIAHGEFAIKIV
jgi:selenide,water dikinase